LTPSEKIYFRYFGPPSSGDNRAGESGSSTPLPNGINDGQSVQQVTGVGIEQNGHSPNVSVDKEIPLNELISHSIIQKYSENLHLFLPQNAATIKNIDQKRFDALDEISNHLLRKSYCVIKTIKLF
jgi:hypothetical protein